MASTMAFAAFCSGGDAPGMNPCLRALALRAKAQGVTALAALDGYKGLCEGNFIPLDTYASTDLVKKGGTVIGTSRYPAFLDPAVRRQAVALLRERGIGAVIGIGGDGTYKGLWELDQLGFPAIGIPGTVDNDIPLTDYTLGFATGVSNCVAAIDRIRDTMESHHRCFVVQVMGRHCGDLALYAGLAAGADAILTQHHCPTNAEVAARAAKARAAGQRTFLVVTAENLVDVAALAAAIGTAAGFETRYEILGHQQRGGDPVYQDRILGTAFGVNAVDALCRGEKGRAVGVRGGVVSFAPLADVCTSVRDEPRLAADTERNIR